MDTEYIFQLKPAEEALLPQLCQALAQRTESCSRRACPNMWALTDRLNGRRAAVPPRLSRRRRILRSILAAVCFLLGLFLVIPFVFQPEGILFPGLVGVFAAVTGAVSLWFCSRVTLAILSLPLGLLLASGAAADPDNLGLFLPLGLLLLVLGAAAILVRRHSETDRFRRAARQLLDARSALPGDVPAVLIFDPEGIRDGDGQLLFPLSALNGVYETDEVWLLELNGKVLFLQKAELLRGSRQEFADFIRAQTPR